MKNKTKITVDGKEENKHIRNDLEFINNDIQLTNKISIDNITYNIISFYFNQPFQKSPQHTHFTYYARFYITLIN